MFKRLISFILCITFTVSNLQYSYAQQADVLQLPAPGTMLAPASDFMPLTLKGLVIHPENALKFDFLMDTGNTGLFVGDGSPVLNNKGEETSPLRRESLKIMKYFLTALTMPEEDMWVNLSPYEKGRIVENNFGNTLMGRDLLAEDYILKQLTASLIYPENELGKKFWKEVYQKAAQELGTTQIPVNTFNKVWIVPSEAVVWEHEGKVMIVKSHLKVMLEEDYLALSKNAPPEAATGVGIPTSIKQMQKTSGQSVRDIILPVLERQVNEGKHFAQLRQMYQAMILATWYKKALKESILNKVYANQKKMKGIDNASAKEIEQIYQQYLKAFKKGAFNYIKDDLDPVTGQSTPRKYFSGGVVFRILKNTALALAGIVVISSVNPPAAVASETGNMLNVSWALSEANSEDLSSEYDTVEELIKFLESDLGLQEYAMLELMKKDSSEIQEAIPHLINKLDRKDTIYYIPRLAVQVLGKTKNSKEVLPILLKNLKDDKKKFMRRSVIEAIGEIGDSSAIPEIRGFLDSRSLGVRLDTAIALKKLGWRPSTIQEKFLVLSAMRKSADGKTIEGNWEDIVNLGEDVEPILIEEYQNSGSEANSYYHEHLENALNIRDVSEYRRWKGVWKFTIWTSLIGVPSFWFAKRKMQGKKTIQVETEPDAAMFGDVFRPMTMLKWTTAVSVTGIAVATIFNPPAAVAQVSGSKSNVVGVFPVVNGANNQQEEEDNQGVNNNDPDFDNLSVSELLKLSESLRDDYREKVAKRLGEMKVLNKIDEKNEDLVVKALIVLVKDRRPDVRTQAVRSLGYFDNELSKKEVRDRLLDERPAVRLAAIEAIGRFKDLGLAKYLFKNLKNGREEERRTAINALSNLGYNPKTDNIEHQFYWLLAQNDQSKWQSIRDLGPDIIPIVKQEFYGTNPETQTDKYYRLETALKELGVTWFGRQTPRWQFAFVGAPLITVGGLVGIVFAWNKIRARQGNKKTGKSTEGYGNLAENSDDFDARLIRGYERHRMAQEASLAEAKASATRAKVVLEQAVDLNGKNDTELFHFLKHNDRATRKAAGELLRTRGTWTPQTTEEKVLFLLALEDWEALGLESKRSRPELMKLLLEELPNRAHQNGDYSFYNFITYAQVRLGYISSNQRTIEWSTLDPKKRRVEKFDEAMINGDRTLANRKIVDANFALLKDRLGKPNTQTRVIVQFDKRGQITGFSDALINPELEVELVIDLKHMSLIDTKPTFHISARDKISEAVGLYRKFIETPDTADANEAMSAKKALRAQNNENLGGIDLNAKHLNLQIKRDGEGNPLPLKQQSLENINIQGFVPSIIEIKPINLSSFLGISSSSQIDPVVKV